MSVFQVVYYLTLLLLFVSGCLYVWVSIFVCGYGDVCKWSTNTWVIWASIWTSPLRLGAVDLWDSHPAQCVRATCHVPPSETLMAPAECVTEWVGDNGAGLGASCVLRLPLVPPALKKTGEDNTLFLNSLHWPKVLCSCHLIYNPFMVLLF